MGSSKREHWIDSPEDHDFPAAADYLGLVMDEPGADRLVAELRLAPSITKKAKDLCRASGLPILPPDNPHVARDLEKVRKGKSLSPVLLVRGDLAAGRPLAIADGYHRICASYHLNEDADIPCRLVSL
ncbi:MAG: hypothetical protein ACYDAY_01380 [Candidatus Dormibacteria bacterium]